MAATPARPLAVIFGTQGGMSDVGKFAAALAFKTVSSSTRVIALAPTAENPDMEIDADVTDQALRDELKADFASMTTIRIDIDAEDAQTKLDDALKDVGAVVACLASRQPSLGRWLARGTEMVKTSMGKNNAERLVILSSMGIGQDFTPLSAIKVLWHAMLRTVLRPARKDLIALEAVVEGSKLDYLLVRPTGLTPEEPPIGSWKLLTAPKQGGLRLSLAKKDVAEFMIKEAVQPTFHRTAVTIGGEPK